MKGEIRIRIIVEVLKCLAYVLKGSLVKVHSRQIMVESRAP